MMELPDLELTHSPEWRNRERHQRVIRQVERSQFTDGLAGLVARFSLGWLVAANLVGVWMALLLVKPEWGEALGEYSYGRWEPLHLDWQLYGWCSLPAMGALFSYFLTPSQAGLRQARRALTAWSAALFCGGLAWLNGQTTGKLFLDWTGFARLIFIGAQLFLWLVLAVNWWGTPGRHRHRSIFGSLLLLLLGGVPFALVWASERKVYPAIDPGTGGPTGASLLGSTLGIILIFSLLPRLLGRRGGNAAETRRHWVCFAASCAVFALLDHRQTSHRDWPQVAGLGTLLAWIPLLAMALRRFHWNEGSRRWLTATLCWWTMLVATGFLEFCPGILDHAKFTHALVAHAHLAMAGLLTSFNMLVLTNLGPAAGPLTARGPFTLWQIGLAVHLLALLALAAGEVWDASWLFQRTSIEAMLYGVRLGAGVMMTAASIWWLASLFRDRTAQLTATRPEPS